MSSLWQIEFSASYQYQLHVFVMTDRVLRVTSIATLWLVFVATDHVCSVTPIPTFPVHVGVAMVGPPTPPHPYTTHVAESDHRIKCKSLMLPCAWSKTLSPGGQWNVGVTSVVGTNCIGVYSPVLCWVTRSFFFRSTCCKGFGPFAVSQRIVTLPFAIEKNTSRCVAHALGIRVYTFMLQSFFFFFQARVIGHSQLPSKDHESPSHSLPPPPHFRLSKTSLCA